MFKDNGLQEKQIDEIIDFTQDVETINPGEKIYYPGEQSKQKRAKNLKESILVNESIWKNIVKLSET